MKKALVLMLVFVFSGCALVEMKRENDETRMRIAQKSTQLTEIEAETERLEQQKQALVNTLGAKKMTLDRLQKELNTLIDQNRRLIRLKKQKQQDIKMLKDDIAYLKQQRAEAEKLQVNDAETLAKEEKIKSLKADIRNYLVLGLKSKHRQKL